MRATLDIPPPTHREVTPVKACESCGAYLRSYGRKSFCEPCVLEGRATVDLATVFKALAKARGNTRERYLSELMGA